MSATGFDALVSNAVAFFRDLDANNNREWFQDQKARYEAEVAGPTKILADVMGAEIEDLNGGPVTPKIFRIHRDVRFSKDKTPYNTHMHVMWKGAGSGAWFFGLSPDYFRVGFGVMNLTGERLTDFRNGIAGPHGSELAEQAEALAAEGVDFGEIELKRVPSPFEKDHPRAEFLKRKGLAGWVSLEHSARVPEEVVAVYARLDRLREPIRAVLGG